jgi:apolipoprotein N-acyltransferase
MLISGFVGQSYLYYQQKSAENSRNAAIISIFLFLFIVLYGYFRLAHNPTTFIDKKIRIVQCNISQENKNNHSLAFENFKKHLADSKHESKIDFIIWPEASIPYLYRENFKQLHDYLRSPLKESEHLLAGAVRKDMRTQEVYNSAVIINHKGENVANYDKSRLLPFGEYVPFREYVPFQSIASEIGDFDVGKGADIFEVSGVKIIFAICYEIVFPNGFIPRETGKNKLSHPRSSADLIVNVTNDGWFGFTNEPFQHLQISRTRAIETGLPLARATNYGISAVFDPCGREIARVPINQSGVIDVNIPGKMYSLFYNLEQRILFFLLFIIALLSLFPPFLKKKTIIREN